MAPVNLIKAGGPISMAGSLRSQTPRIISLSAQNFSMFPKDREALSAHLSDEKEEEKSEQEDTILMCEPTVRETNYTAVRATEDVSVPCKMHEASLGIVEGGGLGQGTCTECPVMSTNILQQQLRERKY